MTVPILIYGSKRGQKKKKKKKKDHIFNHQSWDLEDKQEDALKKIKQGTNQ